MACASLQEERTAFFFEKKKQKLFLLRCFDQRGQWASRRL
jgi:hypothetical protein